MEKLLVNPEDFLHALENDIKPAFGTAAGALETYLARGIINWGTPVSNLIEDGKLYTEQAKASESGGLVWLSDFPFVKICSPDAMVGFTESAKYLQIRKIFDDAYRSTLSCIVVDNVERLLDYAHHKALSVASAKYPINRVDIRTITIPEHTVKDN